MNIRFVSLLMMCGLLLVLMTGPAQSWTGRMAGMDNPYGLVEDESDFLTHPTAITSGKGKSFYGDAGFIYSKVGGWKDTGNAYGIITGLFSGKTSDSSENSLSGHGWNYSGSVGYTFPVNTGRMGIFVQYAGQTGTLSGTENQVSSQSFFIGAYEYSYNGTIDIKNDFSSISARVIYAQPFTDKIKFGGEFLIGWINDDKARNSSQGSFHTRFSTIFLNRYEEGIESRSYVPYKLNYWETALKASMEALMGPSKLNLAVFGGFILGGKNTMSSSRASHYSRTDSEIGLSEYSTIAQTGSESLSGSIDGWRIGAETWWRYPIASGVSLPFVLKTEYGERNRDASGIVAYFDRTEYTIPTPAVLESSFLGRTTYEDNYKYFNFLAGGGVDAEVAKGTRIAAGLYYRYQETKEGEKTFNYNVESPAITSSSNSNITQKEHQVLCRTAFTKNMSPTVSLLAGFSFFYGWLTERYDYGFMSSYEKKMMGYRWGMTGAVGTSFKFNDLSVEPYINGGYQKYNVSGSWVASYGDLPTFELESSKNHQWNVGAGISIKFN